MAKDKTEYEKLIRSSTLFTLDRDTQSTAFRREALKMHENLYLYLMSINSEKYAEFGLEIIETANRCIKNYKPENGDFLSYFNRAIGNEVKKAYARKKVGNHRGGMHIPEHEQRIISHYLRVVEHNGRNTAMPEVINIISAATGIPNDHIEQCISAYQSSYVIEGIQHNVDEKPDLFELIESDELTEQRIIDNEDAIDLLSQINDVYCSRQNRQKPLLSLLLTAKVSCILQRNPEILKTVKKFDFFSEAMFLEVCNRDEPISAREIAHIIGVNESHVSRAFNNFLKLCKERIFV